MPCARADVAKLPATLAVIGAGRRRPSLRRQRRPRDRPCASSPARRVPAGADAIVIQENAERDGAKVIVRDGTPRHGPHPPPRLRLPRGRDAAGRWPPPRARARSRSPPPWATARCPSAAARASPSCRPATSWWRRAAGPAPGRSSPPTTWASPRWPKRRAPRRGCSALPATRARASMPTSPRRTDADVIVTIGGASVGDHDLVGPVLEARGMALELLEDRHAPGQAADVRPPGRSRACWACRAIPCRRWSARACSSCR